MGIQNLPKDQKGKIYVSFSKSQPDVLFNAKRKLSISSAGEKMIASFQCEPKGELLFELQSYSNSTLPIARSKVMGHTSISLEDYLEPVSKLSDLKWLEIVPVAGYISSKPIRLQVAVSFTVPSPAPYLLHMVRSRTSLKSSCLFPLPGRGLHAKNCTQVVDISDTEIVSLQMRYVNLHFLYQLLCTSQLMHLFMLNMFYDQEHEEGESKRNLQSKRGDSVSDIWRRKKTSRICGH